MAGCVNFETAFQGFSKFGDSKSDGKSITLTNSDKWMKQAGVIGKKITTTDTGICFNKFKKRNLTMQEYEKYLQDLAKYKNCDFDEIKQKMLSCGNPGLTNATQASHAGGVERLTDTSKYTGTHKERFDEAGKGKGKAGRVDETDEAGYVTGYKNKETYDKTHPQ